MERTIKTTEMTHRPNSLDYFTEALSARHVGTRKAAILAVRADENWKRYKSLLRSTGIPGMEALLKSLTNSRFSTCCSHSHHHYVTGTLEHSLGVYDELVKLSEGKGIDRNDLILAALLHDIGKGYDSHGKYSGYHPERSAAVAMEFIGNNVHHEVLTAIRHHQHHSSRHLLQNLLCKADHNNAATCCG